MNISDSTPLSTVSRVYRQNTYKKSASAKVQASGDKISASNTDRIEFSAGSASAEKILPERYKESSMAGKIYYKGSNITQYELLETAVKTGAITLDETKSVAYNEEQAMKALIYSKASPLYSWSNKLYSEDRMYTFRVENGEITGMSKTWFDDGTTIIDVAEDLANGTRPCDIDPCKRDWLWSNDLELYKAACAIGSAKRSYFQETEEFNNGHLTKQQYEDEMSPILILLLGKDVDVFDESQHDRIRKFLNSEDFAVRALENYDPQYSRMQDELMSGRYRF